MRIASGHTGLRTEVKHWGVVGCLHKPVDAHLSYLYENWLSIRGLGSAFPITGEVLETVRKQFFPTTPDYFTNFSCIYSGCGGALGYRGCEFCGPEHHGNAMEALENPLVGSRLGMALDV